MKVLFITYDFPYPTNSGGKNRAYHLIKHTAKKAEINLLSFVRDEYNPEHNQELKRIGVKDIKVFKRKSKFSFSNLPNAILGDHSVFRSLYYSQEVESEILNYLKNNKVDIVHFESSYTGFYVGKKIRELSVRQVLGTENIEYMLYESLARNTKKILLKPFILDQARRLKKEELDMVRNADRTTVITKEEGRLFEEQTERGCDVVANGIELDNFSLRIKDHLDKNILFVGNFSYFPNVDGINYFLKEIFPKVDKDIRLTIIGKNSTKIANLNDGRIVCREFVENIIEEYRKADALVFPIRIGGGTNFKVIEAMALGLPIVANPERLSGLGATPSKHFVSALTPNEYVEGFNFLFKNKEQRIKMIKSARLLIEENFSWDKIGLDLLSVWRGSLR